MKKTDFLVMFAIITIFCPVVSPSHAKTFVGTHSLHAFMVFKDNS